MNFIKKLYEFDTAEISDALDSCGIEGALLGIKPLLTGVKMAGPAFTVKYAPYQETVSEFKNAGNYIDSVPSGAVVVIDNDGREDCTTWGDILTEVSLMKNLSGTVVNGAIRDIDTIRQKKYPLYASAVYMRSGKNRVFKVAEQCDLVINNIRIRPDDIIFGDDNGVLVIPKEYLQEIIDKAGNIKSTEAKIINSVRLGMPLEDARKQHRYDQPWLSSDEKND